MSQVILNKLLSELTCLVNNEYIQWEEKYDSCWEIKNKMWKYTSFNWYDPDTSYEEDVLEFYYAAKYHIEGNSDV